MSSAPTLLTPHGYSSSTCGYCSPPGERGAANTSKKYVLEAPQMSCQFYQDMIDKGWRRSGDYVYHPDMARTCCPQYTIRLDINAFKPDRKHRQVMNRWNRFLSTGDQPGGDMTLSSAVNKNGKGKFQASEGSLDTLQEFEVGYGKEGKHRFETVLTPAKATKETFELYKRYQVSVHKDPPSKVSMRGFQRFLCDSPLIESSITYSPGKNTDKVPMKYGSYHLLYKIDNKIVGISVIDILPKCVSSVYFIWDPDWAWASLGKLSALREIALAKEMREAGAEGMEYLYMGYWIPNCQKMRYKSEYTPSFLLDPGTNIFHPLTTQLDTFLQAHPSGYHPLADIVSADMSTAPDKRAEPAQIDNDDDDDDLDDDSAYPHPAPPGSLALNDISDETVNETIVFMQRGDASRLVKMEDLTFRNPQAVDNLVRELLAAVGPDLIANAGLPSSIQDKGCVYFG